MILPTSEFVLPDSDGWCKKTKAFILVRARECPTSSRGRWDLYYLHLGVCSRGYKPVGIGIDSQVPSDWDNCQYCCGGWKAVVFSSLNEALGSSFYSLKEGSPVRHDLSCMGREMSPKPCSRHGCRYGLRTCCWLEPGGGHPVPVFASSTEKIAEAKVRGSDAYPSLSDGGALWVIVVDTVISMVKNTW
jgi:hypothetical protein